MTDRSKLLHPTFNGPDVPSGSQLAHWPPPLLGRDLKPMAIKHRSSEPVKHATRRGWRLTRAMFAEFADNEE